MTGLPVLKSRDILEMHLHKILKAPMPRGRGELFFRTLPPHLGKPSVNGKHHILFLSYYPHVSFVKTAAVLAKTGRFHTTLIGACIREDAEILSFFDAAYEVSDYTELYDIVSRVRVRAIHAAAGPLPFGTAAVSAARESGCRTVLDINDSMLFIKHDPGSEDCVLEKAMIENVNVFTHKMPGKAVEKMREVWKIETPDHELQALPYPGFFAESWKPGIQGPSEPVRIVFAGGLIPYRIARERGFEGHIFTGLVERICSRNVGLTFFVNQNARDMHWEEQDVYFDYERKFPSFHFLKGVPLHRIGHVLADYEYGLYYENSDRSSFNPDHYRYNMATKIYSYLEAGLPVLVPETAIHIAGFVRENGVGAVYRDSDLNDIDRFVSGLDRQSLCRKVDIYRRKNTMEGSLGLFEEIYGSSSIDV